MKVQLKFKNKVYKNYFIDENGVIYNEKDEPQKTYLYYNRPYFKGAAVHKYVMHSFIGYKENLIIHHINENKLDNRLINLKYMDAGEHMRLHKKGKTAWNKGIRMNLSEETRKRMSDAKKGKKPGNYGKPCPQTVKDALKKANAGNTIIRGRIWVNNGVINKMVYPNDIPAGFFRGMLRKVVNNSIKLFKEKTE